MALLKRSGMRVHAVFDGVLRKGGRISGGKSKKTEKTGFDILETPLEKCA